MRSHRLELRRKLTEGLALSEYRRTHPGFERDMETKFLECYRTNVVFKARLDGLVVSIMRLVDEHATFKEE
jgi:hypothetical protein